MVWSDETVHIIVVGCGRVGSELATELSDEGHSVVVIEKKRDSLRRLTHFHGKTIVGSGFDRDVLFQAEAAHADALAAVTSGDNTNILCARIARDHYNIKNVVARIYDPARAEIYMKLGIPTVATSLRTRIPSAAKHEPTNATFSTRSSNLNRVRRPITSTVSPSRGQWSISATRPKSSSVEYITKTR